MKVMQRIPGSTHTAHWHCPQEDPTGPQLISDCSRDTAGCKCSLGKIREESEATVFSNRKKYIYIFISSLFHIRVINCGLVWRIKFPEDKILGLITERFYKDASTVGLV